MQDCNAKTLSNDAEVEAKGARALATCTNSLKHPRVRFCFNQHGGGVIEAKFERGRAINEVWSKDKIVAWMHMLEKDVLFEIPCNPQIKIVESMP